MAEPKKHRAVDNHNPLGFAVPSSVALAEIFATFVGEPGDEGRPEAANAPRVQPTIVLYRRRMAAPSLDAAVNEIISEILREMPGVSGMDTAAFRFADGEQGQLIEYGLDAANGVRVHQRQVVRLDGDLLSTLTLTMEPGRAGRADEQKYLGCLSSLSVPEGAVRPPRR